MGGLHLQCEVLGPALDEDMGIDFLAIVYHGGMACGWVIRKDRSLFPPRSRSDKCIQAHTRCTTTFQLHLDLTLRNDTVHDEVAEEGSDPQKAQRDIKAAKMIGGFPASCDFRPSTGLAKVPRNRIQAWRCGPRVHVQLCVIDSLAEFRCDA